MMSFLAFTFLVLLIDSTLSNPTYTTEADKTTDTTNANIKVDKKELKKFNNINVTKNEVDEVADAGWEFENTTIVDTRRILYSKKVQPGRRPYMVYLQLTKESAKAHKYRGWLCGGVIVDSYYVLTSAACVEDADHFYIVSGTTMFVDSFDYKNDECVCKHRRRVIWKCIPKNYKFDFQDSIKWSSNDIAIVKVDKPFKLGVSEKGCEFAANLVLYNNVSQELEKSGSKGYIVGWGSGSNFREGVYRRQNGHRPQNAKYLQEAKVCVMDNEQCAKKWALRFRNIITSYMICTKDVMKRLSEICDKKYANCTDVESRRHQEEVDGTSATMDVDLGRHLRDPDDYTARRSSKQGGFCENDHGGPLIVKYQGKERVTGVISACKIDPKTHSCHGPFLYTSVFKNRQFISCAIHKDIEANCRRVFRTGITHEEYSVDWRNVDEDEADDKADRDDSTSDENQSARENEPKPKKAKEAESIHESESSSNESNEATTNAELSEKPNKEKKSKKKHHKTVKSKKDNHRKREKRDEVFYESSKDENVNEPDE